MEKNKKQLSNEEFFILFDQALREAIALELARKPFKRRAMETRKRLQSFFETEIREGRLGIY